MTLSLRKPFQASSSSVFGKRLVLSALTAMFFATPAFADNLSDINSLIRSGQFGEALVKVDAALVQAPRDKQMRFMKGVILTEQNKPTEAITVFTKLTEDFPELPEPYNNLAVLFAASGQYDKSRAALEMAIRTNPTYATAHENLGDVYAKLASQAYDKALQLDSGNTTAKSKLTMIRTLVGNTTGGYNPKTPAALPAPIPAPVTVMAAKPAPVVAVVAKAELPKAEPKPEPKLEVKAKPEPKSEPKPEPKAEPKSVVHPDQDDVIASVNNWAKAWSTKDVSGYLGYYASDFQPANNMSRKAWADERRSRIEGKGSISVKIESPRVTIDGSTATVKFRQQYVSNQLRSHGPKTLVLAKQGNKWLIKQERTGG